MKYSYLAGILITVLLVSASSAIAGVDDTINQLKIRVRQLEGDIGYQKLFVCKNEEEGEEEIEDEDILFEVLDYIQTMNASYPLAMDDQRLSHLDSRLGEMNRAFDSCSASNRSDRNILAYRMVAGIVNSIIDDILIVDEDESFTGAGIDEYYILDQPDQINERLLMSNDEALNDEVMYESRAALVFRELRSTATIIVSGANVRKGPSTGYAVITTLSRGESVNVTGESGSWYQVAISGGTGYIYKDLVSVSDSAKTLQGTVTASSLNIRKGPGTSYSIITSVAKGTKLAILGTKYEWYNVKTSDGTEGYAHSSYIIKDDGSDNDNGDDTDPSVSGKAEQIIKSALGAEGKSDVIYGVDCYTATTEYGNLACAAVVSAILKNAGCGNQHHLACVGLRDHLKSIGWSSISNEQYGKGDVCYWTKTSGDRPRHVGVIVAKDVYGKWWTIDNSSSAKEVQKRPLIRSYYPIILPTQRTK
ncbi:MAG: SH3 domain-containing protein [Candidatus Wallbacteria bacterium]|nr:SH3 domain-containing protein [Candidatus Wallbacteria bacterium]